MTETAEQKVARLEAEVEALKRKAERKGLRLQVSAKGAVSVYGLGRFPVSLYRGQWETLLENAPLIREFLAERKDQLDAFEAKRGSASKALEGF